MAIWSMCKAFHSQKCWKAQIKPHVCIAPILFLSSCAHSLHTEGTWRTPPARDAFPLLTVLHPLPLLQSCLCSSRLSRADLAHSVFLLHTLMFLIFSWNLAVPSLSLRGYSLSRSHISQLWSLNVVSSYSNFSKSHRSCIAISHICICVLLNSLYLQVIPDLISSHLTLSYLTSPPHKLSLIAAWYSAKQPLLHSTPAQRGCYSSLPTRTSPRGLYLTLLSSPSLLLLPHTVAEPSPHTSRHSGVWHQACSLSLISRWSFSLNSSSITASCWVTETSISQCHGKRTGYIFQNSGW